MLSFVIFTGDPKNALELDDFDPLGTWAAKSWDVLRVLDGYAAARRRGEFSKGVHAYLSHTPPGRPGYPPGAHSTQESEPVERSPRLRKLRVFPVPRNIHPDGAIFMDAHFKIARKGLVSPRIYYHDDASQDREDLRGLHRQAPPERTYELDIRGTVAGLCSGRTFPVTRSSRPRTDQPPGCIRGGGRSSARYTHQRGAS